MIYEYAEMGTIVKKNVFSIQNSSESGILDTNFKYTFQNINVMVIFMVVRCENYGIG